MVYSAFRLSTSAYENGSNGINTGLVCVIDMNALSTHNSILLFISINHDYSHMEWTKNIYSRNIFCLK